MDLEPCSRFDWERIVKRTPLGASTVLVALTVATYADPDGTRVRPGVDLLAADTGTHHATVYRALGKLRALGLLERTSAGDRRRHQADVYRLTIPENVVDLMRPVDRERRANGRKNGTQPVDKAGDNPANLARSEGMNLADETPKPRTEFVQTSHCATPPTTTNHPPTQDSPCEVHVTSARDASADDDLSSPGNGTATIVSLSARRARKGAAS